MLCVILCGGSGTRFQSQMWPKPMNLVDGLPMFERNIASLQRHLPDVTRFVVLHNRVLGQYDFPRLVRERFPQIQADFVEIPYLTRGAAETCYVGLTEWLRSNAHADVQEPILICDNDIALTQKVTLPTEVAGVHPFVVVQENSERDAVYSYVQAATHVRDTVAPSFEIADIREKQKISDWICVGMYGFASLAFALDHLRGLLSLPRLTLPSVSGATPVGEYFLSNVYTSLCVKQVPVFAVKTSGVQILGTPASLEHLGATRQRPLRVVFDLENTLVTPQTVAGDDASVQPIAHTIAWARQLRAEGHTLIIHTTRPASMGQTTLDTLAKLDIPFDEIVFGKPLGDLVIDDQAINPWDPGAVQAAGFYRHAHITHLPEGRLGTPLLKSTAHNQHRLDPRTQTITKRGPAQSMRGEVYFYEQLQHDPVLAPLRPLFPPMHGTGTEVTANGTSTALNLEYIRGVPLSMMAQYSVVSPQLFAHLLSTVKTLHTVGLAVPPGTREMAFHNYVTKMETRFSQNPEHYDFVPAHEAQAVFGELRERLAEYANSERMRLAYCVHGDCWFANILVIDNPLLPFRFIDMKGALNGALTTAGDPAYDWAKLYQSLAGFDCLVLFGEDPERSAARADQRRQLEGQLRQHVVDQGIAWDDVRMVSSALMFGSYWAIGALMSVAHKRRLWDIIVASLRRSGLGAAPVLTLTA